MYEHWVSEIAEFSFLAEGHSAESVFQYIKEYSSDGSYESLERLKENIQKRADFIDVEFCLCVLNKGFFYALLGGGASVYVVRSGNVYPLLKTLRGTASLVSGKMQEGDHFELETSNSRKIFPDQEEEEGFSQPEFAPAAPKEGSIKLKIAGAIDSLLTHLPERKIVVHGDESGIRRRSRKASYIGVVLLIILGVSIYFGVKQHGETVKKQEYEPQLLEAEHNLQEAISLSTLSHDRARELILASKKEADGLKKQGVEDERLDSLVSDISDHLGSIAGIYDEPAEVYMDLSIISSGFEANDLAFSEGLLRVLDGKSKKLAGIETDTKRTKIISGPDYLPDAISTVAYADRSFILSSDGIREVTGDPDLVIKPDGWDPKNVLVYAFAGNIYVLDKTENQIWRYQGVRGGFLDKEAWLGEGFNKDTSDSRFYGNRWFNLDGKPGRRL